MSANQEIYLETTIMIDRLCKGIETKRRVEQVLTKYRKSYTSRYTKMEFKKGFLQNLIYLHGKIVQCNNLNEVFSAISKLSVTPQKNKLRTILESISVFYKNIWSKKPSEIIETYGDITIDEYLKNNAESFLDRLIRKSWKEFDNVVDETINPTNCFIDMEDPRKIGRIYDNTPRTCDKSKLRCGCREFFNRNSQKFSAIREKLKVLPNPDNETVNRIRSLKKILRVSNREIRSQDCWYCGDAIMAVEAPNGADVFNNNPMHYIPICEAIKKRSVGYGTY